MIVFLGKSGPSKIRLIQCYAVLWIYVIDAICSSPIRNGKEELPIYQEIMPEWGKMTKPSGGLVGK